MTVGVDGRTEGMSGLARVEVDREVADFNFPHPQRLPFRTFVLSRNSRAATLFVRAQRMQFEVLATCHTTRARVSRMKLARRSFDRSIVFTVEVF